MKKPLSVGDRAEVEACFEAPDIALFAKLSGDTNPLHIDPDFASTTVFKRPVVHGALVVSLFSRLLGTVLPGEGTIYLGQTSNFRRPLFVGEKTTASVELIKLRDDKPIAIFKTMCLNSIGEVVIDGEATVKLSTSSEY